MKAKGYWILDPEEEVDDTQYSAVFYLFSSADFAGEGQAESHSACTLLYCTCTPIL
jgi:hypothetical protein